MAFLYTGGGFLNSCNYQFLDDSVLSALSKKGDGKAFEEITIRYIKLICSVAKKYSAYGYELQDFIQEGLLSFLLACKTYSADCGSSYKNYAVKCTKNRFADIVKKANAKGSVPANKIVSIHTVEDEQDLSNNVEDYVLEREYLKTFLQHISSTLNEEERNIFQMYINGYSYKDIADKLGISTKNVDNILQKIKRKLRQ
ncbi:MAG: sigma-70 family RNA polymerase sigma factor [Ruminococcus sp.]